MHRDAAMEDDAAVALPPRWARRLGAPDCAAAMSPLSVADTAAIIASFHAPTTATTAATDNKRAPSHRMEPTASPAPSPWFHELLATCLAFLDGVALLKCELVSREWHAAVQDPALWAAHYSAVWRGGAPLPAPLLLRARAQLKRVCRARSTTPLGLSTRAMWWVHDNQTLRVHNVSLQRTFSRGCVESVRADHALRPLAFSRLSGSEGVCYYEVTIRGCGSVGVVRLDEPNADRYYGAGSSAHVGWLPGSYGYHGDDGKIYWHDGAAPIGGYAVRYGPSWGDTRVLQSALPAAAPGQRGATVGCGVDLASGRLFFTRNGEFLGHATMPVERSRRGLSAAVSLHHLGDTAELNFGRAAFAFDIEAYLAERAAAPAF